MNKRGFTEIFFTFFMFFMSLLGYSPMKAELNELATNATLTNAIYKWLDSSFGLWYSMLCITFLAFLLYALYKNV